MKQHKLQHAYRAKPFIYSKWAKISQSNRKDGHLTKEGEILLQEYMFKELTNEVGLTAAIEKENEKLTNLVNTLKDKFIQLKSKK